jgi:prepilin-type N-terminal cleavage/methylation domain-containing protein
MKLPEVGTLRRGIPGRVQRPELLQATMIEGARCAATTRRRTSQAQCPYHRAFTLIELLVVIAIIAILSLFFLSAMRDVNKARQIKLAHTELIQMETAIEDYQASRGYYPPDNPNNPALNPLLFELKGSQLTTVNGQPTYVTLDGSAQIAESDLSVVFGSTVKGIMNLPKLSRRNDEESNAETYLKNLRPSQTGQLVLNGQPRNAILACSIPWTDDPNLQIISTQAADNPHAPDVGLNPWQYRVTNPQHNSNAYDLWVDLYFNGKTNRISNWASQPQVL